MKKFISFIVLFAIFTVSFAAFGQKGSNAEIKQLQSPQNPAIGLMLHGGAGVIKKGEMTPEKERAYRAQLEEALLAGYKALKDGKSSLDAVEIAIRIMEDSPLFNAGKGEDASIMDGKTLAAGAVAGLRHVKNPITLARAVMEKSPHVMMAGEGAEKFALEQKSEKEVQSPKPKAQSLKSRVEVGTLDIGLSTFDYNQFGAVALDRSGNLAAGTSTGGVTDENNGGVGAAAIIGAGTYANNNSCAVSAIGRDAYLIRLGVARDISAIMEYQAATVQDAADRVIRQKLQKLGGSGGVIAIDKFGNMAISFNTEGMYRAYINAEGKPVVEIYK